MKFALTGFLLLLVLLAGVYRFFSAGPWSFRAEYRKEVERGLARKPNPGLVTEADLAPLPAAVQRYLRVTHSVGQPRVLGFRVRFRGQIRGGPDAPWMPFIADQHSFEAPRTRLFLMKASRAGIPFEALHLYRGAAATMRVKLASLVRIVDASGPEMDRSETVTLFNDMCLLAPPMLLDPSIRWEELEARKVRATFTNAGHTIRAELSFNEQGELVDFSSEDRSMSSADGRSFTRLRWTTPVREYRTFGPRRLAAKAEALWHPAEGGFSYGHFEIVEIEFNPG